MLDNRQGVCPLCEHNEIVEAVPAEFGESNMEVSQQAITYDPRWLMSGRNPVYPHGKLMVYVCRRCGYVQWFAENPEGIPIGAEYQTRLIEGEGERGPYR